MDSFLKMINEAGSDPDFNDALTAFIEADKAREKARKAFERADRLADQREADLRAIYKHLTEGEGGNA